MSSRKFLICTTTLVLVAAVAAKAQVTQTPARQTTPVARQKGGLEEVVVTARRRAERAQTTPISVSVLSASTLKAKNIQRVDDLNAVVPGFRFGSNGGKNNNDTTLRGLSKIPLGEGVPAVVTYFADVPLPPTGSNVPFFDISNVQVFKGPQGTLFGRNTLGGAVVITPTAPTDQIGGYLDLQVGNYNHVAFTGAVNVPFVPDKVELRISGQEEKQNGFVKNLDGGPNFSNVDENSYRVSLLFHPTDYIKSTTIYDYSVAPEYAAGDYLSAIHPGVIPGLSPLIDPQLAVYYAGQKKAGPYAAYDDGIDGGKAFRRGQGVTNDTRVDLTDDISIRNIVGYRKLFDDEAINTGAAGPLTVMIPGVGTLPFTFFDANQVVQKEYVTEEIQLIGHSWNNRINWILGGFYNHDDPTGGMGTNFRAFEIGPSTGTYTTSLYTDNNYALYGQASIDLSQWTVQGLKFNAGYRYSWDQVHACSGSFANGYADVSECEAAAVTHSVGGSGDIGATGSDPSWTVGFDYQYSSKQFFYVTSRRGYRGVGVNTPLFTSPYTTGGVVVPAFPGAPGCTGPGNKCPDLRPFQKTAAEKLTDVEIGSKTDFHIGSVNGRFDIDAYWSKYDNALQFLNVAQTGIYLSAPDLPNSQSVGVNAANETIEGTEASLILQPTDGLTLNLDGAYTNAVIDSITAPTTTGLVLQKSQITLPSPRFSGSVSVNYVAPVHPLQGDLVFTGDYYQTGRFGGQYGQKLPGYGVGNARIALNDVEGKGIDISLYVKNILDRAYIISAVNTLSTFPANSVLYAEPRTYGIEARLTF